MKGHSGGARTLHLGGGRLGPRARPTGGLCGTAEVLTMIIRRSGFQIRVLLKVPLCRLPGPSRPPPRRGHPRSALLFFCPFARSPGAGGRGAWDSGNGAKSTPDQGNTKSQGRGPRKGQSQKKKKKKICQGNRDYKKWDLLRKTKINARTLKTKEN